MQGYLKLPAEVKSEFQDLCNGTIGRAIQSLLPVLGEDHDVIRKLRSIVTEDAASSPDDFRRQNARGEAPAHRAGLHGKK
jgi:hypothetical protein